MTVLIIIGVVAFVAAVLVAAIRPSWGSVSLFELKRRAKQKDTHAVHALERAELLPIVIGMVRTKALILLLAASWLWIAGLGWTGGIVASMASLLLLPVLSRLRLIQRPAMRIYAAYEAPVLGYAKKGQAFLQLFAVEQPRDLLVPNSHDELLHILKTAPHLLTPQQYQLIAHGLPFTTATVAAVMTPRSSIRAVQITDILGPFVLDELHKTGHTAFPVTDGSLDTVVGMVRLDIVTIRGGEQSHSVRDAMTPNLCFVRSDYTLPQALAAFRRTHQPLMIVVDQHAKTVGLLSIGDLLGALVGTKKSDSFAGDYSAEKVSQRA